MKLLAWDTSSKVGTLAALEWDENSTQRTGLKGVKLISEWTLNIDATQLPIIWATMIAGSLSLSLLASIGGAVSAGLRRGGLLISLLVLPLYAPVLIFGIAASSASLGPTSATPALIILCALTMISLVVAPWASAAALKAHLR